MDTRTPQPLDYAPARTPTAGRRFFRSALALMAGCGVVVNSWLVRLTVEAVHRSRWAYRDLTLDARAFGREIDPATIASLREPHALWATAAALAIVATFGLLLAIHLLRAAWQVDRAPERGWRAIVRYRRWKGAGAAATAAAFFAFGNTTLSFRVAATRHYPVGSGPPVIETLALLAGALLPWWWVCTADSEHPGPGPAHAEPLEAPTTSP